MCSNVRLPLPSTCNALMSADGGGMAPEASDLFHSALSDEYYDNYSDVY